MTSTPVSNIGSAYMGTTAAGASGKAGQDGFKNVMDQAGKDNRSSVEEQKTSDTVKRTTVDKSSEMKLRRELNREDKMTNEAAESGNVMKNAEPEPEVIEEAVTEAVEEIVDAIATAFEISPETVEEVVDQLELTMTDLLRPENLTQLVTTLSGEDNPMALATDETLYAMRNELTNLVNETTAELTKQMGMNLEEMEEVLKELTAMAEPEATNLTLDEENVESNMAYVNVDSMTKETDTNLIQTKQPAVTTEEDMKTSKETSDRPETYESQTYENIESTEEATVTDRRSEDKNESHGENRENSQNAQGMSFQENLAKAPNIEATTVHEIPTANTEIDGLDLIRQISDYMNLRSKDDLAQMELQLHPASLGTVQIAVTSKAGVVSATIQAQTEAVKNAIEAQVVTLRDNLEQQGIKVEAVEVTVASHEFERNLSDHQSDKNGEDYAAKQAGEIRRKSLRKINLNETEGEEAMETEEDEAEELLKDMMRRSGNTVDFTA